MNTLYLIDDLQAARKKLAFPVGLVPTMGYLHEGHISLVRRARRECASVIATIFVNPTQFGPQEDFAAYPRDLPRDLALFEQNGVDIAWLPEQNEMYPPDFQTWVNVEDVTQPLEGKMRPGHFRGVTTIVAKLFNAAQPDRAYFGQKDAQQAVVIRKMAEDLNFPIEIIICPTVRESDGLAMSSRNVYLDPAQRQAALVLYKSLKAAHEAFINGINDAEQLRLVMSDTISQEPLAKPQYVSCANPETLKELSGPVSRALISLAVVIGKTRLIDNLLIGEV